EDGWPLRRAAERFQVAVTTGEALGRPLPRARPGRDGRPFQPPVAQSTPHFASAGATDPGGAPDPPQRPALIGFLLRIPRLAHLDRVTGGDTPHRHQTVTNPLRPG